MVSAAVARVFKRDIDSNISSVAPLSDTPEPSSSSLYLREYAMPASSPHAIQHARVVQWTMTLSLTRRPLIWATAAALGQPADTHTFRPERPLSSPFHSFAILRRSQFFIYIWHHKRGQLMDFDSHTQTEELSVSSDFMWCSLFSDTIMFCTFYWYSNQIIWSYMLSYYVLYWVILCVIML